MKILQPGVPMRKSLNEEHSCVAIKNYWNTDCPELGYYFHFDCAQPALVEVEVLFVNCVLFIATVLG